MVLVKNLYFFYSLFFDQIGPKKVFHGIVNRKVAFLDYKNIKLKSDKWSNDFCPKFELFSQYGPRQSLR